MAKFSFGGGANWATQVLRELFGAGAPHANEVAIATELLQSLGYDVTPRRRGAGVDITSVTGRQQRTRQPPPLPPGPPGPPAPPTGIQPPAPGQPSTFFSTRNPPRGAPPLPGEESPFGEEIRTPQSSNVYSFSYHRRPHDRTGTLYVRYKAHAINPDSVSMGKGTYGGRQQLHGELGSTVGRGRSDEPGPLYAYYNVPPVIYTRMQDAHSKGKFVWDALRVRGTVYGHKFSYGLVQGQVTPSVGGVYIPRRATKQGFRTRSVTDVGTGRRGFQSSTLPQQQGFSTRRK